MLPASICSFSLHPTVAEYLFCSRNGQSRGYEGRQTQPLLQAGSSPGGWKLVVVVME